MPAWVAARAVDSLQRAPQRIDFPLVTQFLTLGELDQLQDFLHLPKRLPQFLDNVRHFIDRPADRRTFEILLSASFRSFPLRLENRRRFGYFGGSGNNLFDARFMRLERFERFMRSWWAHRKTRGGTTASAPSAMAASSRTAGAFGRCW